MTFAILMSQAKWVERSFYPYAVALQTVPILALTPLIGQFFDYNFRSRVIVCVIISLFPIIANTLFGLLSADQGHHDLFRLHGAGRWTRLWKLQFPGALPAIFTGLRISAGLSVIGAIVGDFFFRRGDARPRRADHHLPVASADGADLRRADPRHPARHRHVLGLRPDRQEGRRLLGRQQPAERVSPARHPTPSRNKETHGQVPKGDTRPARRRAAARRRRLRQRQQQLVVGHHRRAATTAAAAPPPRPAGPPRRPRRRHRRRQGLAEGRLPRRPSPSRPTGTPRPSTATCTR